MDKTELLSLILGSVGTLVALLVAIAGRQLMRPRFTLDLGLFDVRSELPLSRRFVRSNSLAVGISACDLQYIILHCPLRLTNRRGVPVNDVEVVLEFPAEALVEDFGLSGPIGSTMVKSQPAWGHERKVYKLGEIAQVRIPIGVLRPRETHIVSELLQLKAGRFSVLSPGSGDQGDAHLRRRYSSANTLRGAIQVRAMAWSSSLDPLSKLMDVMWFAVEDSKGLYDGLTNLARLSWQESSLSPGIYLTARPWRPLVRRELVQLTMLHMTKVEDFLESVSPDVLFESGQGGVILKLPPWGLWGESFDIRRKRSNILLWRWR